MKEAEVIHCPWGNKLMDEAFVSKADVDFCLALVRITGITKFMLATTNIF